MYTTQLTTNHTHDNPEVLKGILQDSHELLSNGIHQHVEWLCQTQLANKEESADAHRY